MNELDDLIAQIPMDQLAAQLGVERAEAEQATRTALPALLGGLEANANDEGGKASLLEALGQHGPELDGGVDLSSVDTDDGQKIVDHIFGDQRDAVVDRLSGQQGSLRDLLEGRESSDAPAQPRSAPSGGGGGMLSGGLLSKLLPLLAPLVMAWLSKKMGGGGGTAASADEGRTSGGGLGDILGDVLGGGGAGSRGGGLGDILGDLLGGGRKA